ncbi:hypothetical protein HWV62_44385 [Athelia sp. TMB]|nr:hypothetical protein HWV62_44385 [Athelia sp. TMB]
MASCTCGIPANISTAVVLTCEHIVCPSCHINWCSGGSCEQCLSTGIQESLDGNKDRQVSRLEHADLSPYCSRLFGQRPGLEVAEPVDKKRKADDVDEGNRADTLEGEKSPDQSRKRPRAQDYTEPESVHGKRKEEKILLSRIRQLKTELDEVRSKAEYKENAYKDRLVTLKQYVEAKKPSCFLVNRLLHVRQLFDVAKKAKDSNVEAMRRIKKQEDVIKAQGYDHEQMKAKLRTAENVVDLLRLEVQRKVQAVRNAEQKGAEFEDWGRETKAHYRELVRQMESDLRSPTKPAASNLPTLQRAVPGMDSIYSDIVATPKKKSRASLPAPRTPLHLLLQNRSNFVPGSFIKGSNVFELASLIITFAHTSTSMSSEVLPVPVDAAKLLAKLAQDLAVPDEINALQSSCHFEGDMPILPIPHKSQAISAALLGLLGIASARLIQQRNGSATAPRTSINTNQATILFYSIALGKLGDSSFGTPKFVEHLPSTNEEHPSFMRNVATNVFKCKDGRYFHMHGSLRPSVALKALDLDPDLPVNSEEEAQDVVAAACARYTAEELRQIYESSGLVGDIVLEADEYDASEQGKIINSLPLARFVSMGDSIPAAIGLAPLKAHDSKPLEGVRVLEFSRVIAGPVAGRLLAELGATVVKVIDKNLPDIGLLQVDYNLDKRTVFIDARSPDGKAQLEHLLETADVFLQGYRPGAMEHLDLSHERLASIGARRGKPFVIIDESCYGGRIENAPSSMRPGYQQIADSTTGIAWQTGRACGKDSPIVPPLPISDYCTGLLCATMAVLGLVRRQTHTDTVFAPVALAAVDLWIRKQEQYPAEWVLKTYQAGPQFDYTWGFLKMLNAILHDQQTNHPEYFQPSFFAKTPSKFVDPGATAEQEGPIYTHLAPLVKIDGVASGFKLTVPLGHFRPGWDEADADLLENRLKTA